MYDVCVMCEMLWKSVKDVFKKLCEFGRGMEMGTEPGSGRGSARIGGWRREAVTTDKCAGQPRDDVEKTGGDDEDGGGVAADGDESRHHEGGEHAEDGRGDNDGAGDDGGSGVADVGGRQCGHQLGDNVGEDNDYDGESDGSMDGWTGEGEGSILEASGEVLLRVLGGRASDTSLITADALLDGKVTAVRKTHFPSTGRRARTRRVRAVEKLPWSSDLLDKIAPGDIPQGAALFHSLSSGNIGAATVASIIEEAAVGKSSINFIVWVNRHWVATCLVPGASWKIYDSSRNSTNERTIRQWSEAIGLPIPTFPGVPQQRRFSEECGIFTFLNMHRLCRGLHIPKLRPLPQQLLPKPPSMKRLTSLLTDLKNAAEVGWKILNDYHATCDNVQWSTGGGLEYDIGTHLRVCWHWMGKPDEVFDERAIVSRQYGTKRSTTHVLTFEASSDLSGGNQIFTLPPPSGSNVVVLQHEVDTSPRATEDSDNDPEAPESDPEAEEEHHRFYEDFLRETRMETYGDPDSKASTGIRPITVDEFRSARIRDLGDAREVCPTLVWTAMVTDTRKGHIKELKGLQEFSTTLPKHTPLDYAIALYAEDARRTRDLSWSTVSRILQSLIGAFAVFPNYATGESEEFPPILISRWPGVRDSLKTAKRLSNVMGVKEPIAATAAQVAEAMGFLELHDKVFLQVCWLTSQRPGDVVHVRPCHVRLIEDKAVIRFAEGKNHAATDPYAIHCVIPQPWLPEWKKLMEKKRKYVFEVASKSARASLMTRLRLALRRTAGGKELEMKSLRRGSLQIMATNGASVAELLKFSRHQDAKTLRRYLSYDSVADAENQRALEHTRILGGGLSTKGALHEVEVVRPEPWCSIRKDGDVVFGPPPKPRITKDRSGYRYHIKDIPPLQLDEISRLAENASEQVREDWKEAKLYLVEPSLFAGAIKGPPLKSRIRRKMLRLLKKVKQIKEVRLSVAKNFCIVFVVPEDDKLRWRIIKHPEDINNALREMVEEMTVTKTNATRRESRFRVLDHPGCIEFDFAGYFDQFPLSPEVAEHFVFYDGSSYHAPLRMPMGVSFAVAVATAATRVLTYGIDAGLAVEVDHQIDNVRIAGHVGECEVAAQRFLGRCRVAGVTLNTEYKYGEANDFMGDVVNFSSKTISCRKKQLDRLVMWAAKVRRPEATYRDWFACYCSATYMAEALGVTPAQYLRVRLFMRELARAVARAPMLWDMPMLIAPPWEAWHTLLGTVRQNIPATLVPHPGEVTNLFVDASVWGYGALSIGPGGERDFMFHRWPEGEGSDGDYGLSTVAEPRALVEAVRWIRKRHPTAAVHVFTDHRPFVDAFWRCGSFSPVYNKALLDLGAMETPMVLHHIVGAKMPADKLSRGYCVEPTEADWQEAARWVEDCALCSWRYYRIVGGGIGARTFASGGPLAPPL